MIWRDSFYKNYQTRPWPNTFQKMDTDAKEDYEIDIYSSWREFNSCVIDFENKNHPGSDVNHIFQ